MKSFLFLFLSSVCTYIYADSKIVQMKNKSTGTFYVDASVDDRSIEMLVDTGSSYTILDQDIIDHMHLKPVKHVSAVFADGRRQRIAIYNVPVLTIFNCVLHDVQTAGMSDNILGITALNKMSPMTLDLKDQSMVFQCGANQLVLHCRGCPPHSYKQL